MPAALPAALPALLAAFIVSACGHALYNGSRMIVSLMAITLEAGPATLGALGALGGLLPTLFGVPLGRLIDRVGVARPVMGSLVLAALGILAPGLWPSYWTLALASLLAGLAFMMGIIGANKAVAMLTSPERRAGQLGWLSATSSIGGSAALMALGYAVDHYGHRASFMLTALVPAVSCLALATLGRSLPRRGPDAPAQRTGSTMDLWRDAPLRRMLLLSAVVPVANDTFSFLMPIIASNLGWSATLTGIVMGSALGAAMLARALLPWTTRVMRPWTLLAVSFVAISGAYLLMPVVEHPLLMAVLALTMGLGTGMAPPVLSALLYEDSPPGRQGEVFGMRGSLQFALAAGAPLAVGALGTFVGLSPMIWAMGFAMSWAARVSFRERARRAG